MVTIDVAAVTLLSPSNVPQWAGLEDIHPTIRLWGGISDTEIANLLVALANQNGLTEADSFETISRRLVSAETPMLNGGIRISDGEQTIMPGCCCGFKDWPNQIETIQGRRGWFGHDPSPFATIDGSFMEFGPMVDFKEGTNAPLSPSVCQ